MRDSSDQSVQLRAELGPQARRAPGRVRAQVSPITAMRKLGVSNPVQAAEAARGLGVIW